MTELLQGGLHVFAHSTLAMATASLGEYVFPKFEPSKPMIIMAVEATAQLLVSSMVLGELIRNLSPSGAGYVSPIGDGFAVYFLMEYQPAMRDKFHKIIGDLIGKEVNFVSNIISSKPSSKIPSK